MNGRKMRREKNVSARRPLIIFMPESQHAIVIIFIINNGSLVLAQNERCNTDSCQRMVANSEFAAEFAGDLWLYIW